jgi:hypothetical protein
LPFFYLNSNYFIAQLNKKSYIYTITKQKGVIMTVLEEFNMIKTNLLKQTEGDQDRAIARLIGHIEGLEIVLESYNAKGWGKLSEYYGDKKTEAHAKTRSHYRGLTSED